MSDDYTKSLEETIAKQERIIEDFVKDRERIAKMLEVIRKSYEQITEDIEKLANPHNPSNKEDVLKIVREVMKKKITQYLLHVSNDISVIIGYSNTDPSEHVKTGKHWVVPDIRTVKDRY